MMQVRRAQDRFRTRLDWLDSRHSFSFGGHYDPSHMGFRALRVINDDVVTAGAGFGTHGHRDMEILSFVLDGALEHKDNMGNGSVIRPGEVQRMTAGTGVRHSEFNHEPRASSRFLQVWILPERRGIEPGYEQKRFAPEEMQGRLRVVASRDGRDGSVVVHQDVDVWAGRLQDGDAVEFALREGRGLWVQVAKGDLAIDGTMLGEGDGVAVQDVSQVRIVGKSRAELLLFDLA